MFVNGSHKNIYDHRGARGNSLVVMDSQQAPGSASGDYNIPGKHKGFITLSYRSFQFMGPDRPKELNRVKDYIQAAKIIKSTGVPNYRQARIPIKSHLKLEAWEKYLQDYLDYLH